MKKQTLAIIIGIFLLTTVIAGGVLTTLDLSSKTVDTLKAELPIDKDANIEPTYSDMICDKVRCKSWISYYNLINTEWTQDKRYCSEWIDTSSYSINKTIDTICEYNQTAKKDICKDVIGQDYHTIPAYCKTYSEYTKAELETMRTAWVKSRLESFAGYLEDKK